MFEKQKVISRKLIRNYQIKPKYTHVSLVTYGETPNLVLNLQSGTSNQVVKSQIDQLNNPNDGNGLIKALKFLISTVFTETNGVRLGVTKRAVVFFNKTFVENPLELQKQVQAVENAGIKIIFIGLGDVNVIDPSIPENLFGDAYFFPDELDSIDRIIVPIVRRTRKGEK